MNANDHPFAAAGNVSYGGIGANGLQEISPLVIVRKLASGTGTHSDARELSGSDTIARASDENLPTPGAMSIAALWLAL